MAEWESLCSRELERMCGSMAFFTLAVVLFVQGDLKPLFLS